MVGNIALAACHLCLTSLGSDQTRTRQNTTPLAIIVLSVAAICLPLRGSFPLKGKPKREGGEPLQHTRALLFTFCARARNYTIYLEDLPRLERSKISWEDL